MVGQQRKRAIVQIGDRLIAAHIPARRFRLPGHPDLEAVEGALIRGRLCTHLEDVGHAGAELPAGRILVDDPVTVAQKL